MTTATMQAHALRAKRDDLSPRRPLLQRVAGALLAPALHWQRQRIVRTMIDTPYPDALPYGRAGTGMTRVRLLIVGDALALGAGVHDASETLAPQLAQRLSDLLSEQTRSRTSVSWQLVAASGLTTREAMTHLAATRLQTADVLVTVLGLHDMLEGAPVSRWLHDLDALRSNARNRAKVRFTVHCVPPPLALMPALPQPLRWVSEPLAGSMDRALHGHIRHSDRRSRYLLPFDTAREDAQAWSAADGLHPNAAMVQRWAHSLAEHIEFDISQAQLRRATLPTGFQPTGFPASGFANTGHTPVHHGRRDPFDAEPTGIRIT